MDDDVIAGYCTHKANTTLSECGESGDLLICSS